MRLLRDEPDHFLSLVLLWISGNSSAERRTCQPRIQAGPGCSKSPKGYNFRNRTSCGLAVHALLWR
jgi:hypothetical protein